MENKIQKHPTLHCGHCNYNWMPLRIDRKPKECPNCKTRNWDLKLQGELNPSTEKSFVDFSDSENLGKRFSVKEGDASNSK